MNYLMTDFVRSAPKARNVLRVCCFAFCLMFSLAFTVSIRAATLCVDQHGKPGCVATITAAVNAALPGDTVQVDAGYYAEDVVIGTQMSLVGAGAENTIIDASGLSNGIYIDGLDNPKLTQVVVSGFTVKNANFEGIFVNDTTDVTIFRNVVRNNDLSLQLPTPGCINQPSFETSETADCGGGLHLMGVAHSTVSNNIVTQNAGGILVSDETGISHDDLITRNLVMDNQYAGGITLSSNPASPGLNKNPAYGIDYIVVSDNDSIHNGFGGGSGGPGVGLYAAAPGNLVSTNTIIGNRLIGNFQPGVVVLDNGYIPGSTSNPDVNRNVFAHNYIAGNGSDPDAPTTVPTGISIVGATPVVDVLVTGNQIEGEGIDIAFSSSSTLSIHLNNLGGGKTGIALTGTAGKVNATENWWGCPGGPGAAGCSGATGMPILFTPWLTRPVDVALDHHRDFGFGHHYFFDRDHDYNFDHHDCDFDHDWGYGH
jgi:parallel beta-helix repeat protein